MAMHGPLTQRGSGMRNGSVSLLTAGLILAACQSGAPPTTPQPASTQVLAAASASPHKLTTAELRALNSAPHTAYSVGRFGPKTNAGYFTPDGQIRFRSPD